MHAVFTREQHLPTYMIPTLCLRISVGHIRCSTARWIGSTGVAGSLPSASAWSICSCSTRRCILRWQSQHGINAEWAQKKTRENNVEMTRHGVLDRGIL